LRPGRGKHSIQIYFWEAPPGIGQEGPHLETAPLPSGVFDCASGTVFGLGTPFWKKRDLSVSSFLKKRVGPSLLGLATGITQFIAGLHTSETKKRRFRHFDRSIPGAAAKS